MSEKTEPVVKEASSEKNTSPQQDLDLQELAEHIVKLMLREIELERLRTGNYY
jgi:hypothetical protein